MTDTDRFGGLTFDDIVAILLKMPPPFNHRQGSLHPSEFCPRGTLFRLQVAPGDPPMIVVNDLDAEELRARLRPFWQDADLDRVIVDAVESWQEQRNARG